MAILIGSGVAVGGNLVDNADTDVYLVSLQAGEVYDFWLAPDPDGGVTGADISDAFLTLVGPGGSPVVQDDDSGEGLNATFAILAPAAGDYTLTAEERSGTGDGGDYVLTFVDKSRESDISDHIVATSFTSGAGPDATIAGVGTNAALAEEDVLTSSIASRAAFGNTDVDLVAVFLTAGQTYTFTVQGATSGVTDGITDANLRLLDGDGVDTGLAPVVNGSDETLSGAVAGGQGGWYFLEVSGGGAAAGNYRLSFDDATSGVPFSFDVAGSAGPQTLNGTGDTIAANPFNLPLGDTIQGDIEISGDADWYAINLVAGFTYRFTAEGGTLGNLTLQVRDSAGVAVGGGSSSGAEPQSVEITIGASGLYYIDLHGQGAGDTGTFALSSTLVSTVGVTAHDITGLGGTEYDGSDLFDVITGGDEADDIDGRDGNDTLSGGLGDDTIGGGETGGSDLIAGDAGNDLLFGDGGNDTVDGGADDDTVQGGLGDDSLLGGLGADSIDAGNVGDSGSNTVEGGDGNDTINGSVGTADLLSGGANDDSITSAGSGDSLNGGDGNDILSTGLSAGPTSLDGGLGNDNLLGGSGNDTMLGGENDDTLDGGAGTNQMNGGNGNDTFANVDAGDLVTAGGGVDHVQSLIGWTLDSDEENLTLIGGATINGNGNGGGNVIFGNNVANVLSGLAGNDTVSGNSGNDTLIGGAGKDLNTGGGGQDHIKYNALSDSGTTFASRDAINTFAHGDKIDLSAIDANTKVAGNQAFHFQAGFNGTAGQLIAQFVATNSFLVQADINGDNHADFTLNVYTAPGFGSFQSWDFIL